MAQPVYSWGVVRRVEFPGVNIDIGHMRNLAWSRSNDKAQWVAYNRMRGQYMSALEHAVPERFFSDPAKCNLAGSANPVAGLPECPQGISAVKALGLAAQQGQKIYTITPQVYASQPNIVNTALVAHSPGTRAKVQAALDEGKEVTIHEAPIAQSGWVGAGFTVIEEGTGAGAYTIEGGSQGAWLGGFAHGVSFAATVAILVTVAGTSIGTLGVVGGVLASLILATVFFAIHLIVLELATRGMSDEQLACYNGGFGAGGAIWGIAAAMLAAFIPTVSAAAVAQGPAGIMLAVYSIPGLVAGMELASTDRPSCFK